MNKKLAFVISIIALVALRWSPVAAHHAFSAEFDEKKPVNLAGEVTKMEWINPHAWIYMDVKGQGGKVEQWMVEAGAPNALLRRGFSKTSLMPGTVVRVEGFQAKDGALRANGREVTLADGSKLFIGTEGVGAPKGDDKK
jgi:hypothetical protein